MTFFKKLFYKLKIGLKRLSASSLPYTPAEKRYGNNGESEVYTALRRLLPDAVIARNVCLDPGSAKGEIDYLIVYQNKAFVVELKTWEGRIYQVGDTFYKDKESSGGETYTKELKSPFKQVRRSVYQLKQQFPYVWFEPIVLFQNSDSVKVTEQSTAWFGKITEMVAFIRQGGKPNRPANVQNMLENLVFYDTMRAASWVGKTEMGIIDEDAFINLESTRPLRKRDICEIRIEHYFSYDTLYITMRDGSVLQARNETGRFWYTLNGYRYTVAINKVDSIHFGSI